MPKREHSQGRLAHVVGVLALSFVLLGLLAGCSSGGGGSGSSKLSLGLAGSTADHPAQPPTLNGGPNGTLAFVYDNQIWLSKSGQSGATQLTHLVLSNGANIAWGPLAWSKSGQYIAFALVQNLTPTAPGGTSGPIYYVDTKSGLVYNTGATGSIYGHSYAWFGDSMIFYGTGGGILMFGPVNVAGADPRTWQALSQIHNPSYDGVTYEGSGVTYDDIAIGKGNGDLFYSRIVLSSPGSSGSVGNVEVMQTGLPSLDQFTKVAQLDQQNNTNDLPGWIAQNIALTQGAQVADLGSAYMDAAGDIVTGAWNISPDESKLVAQHINGVDTKGSAVSSSICKSDYQGYIGGYGYCAPILGDAGKAPLSAHLEIGVSPGGRRVAYTNGTLYIANTDGHSESKLANAGWTVPPAWADDKTVTVTQLASSNTDANGVIHNATNILTFSDGSSGATFISGGQNPSWYYGG